MPKKSALWEALTKPKKPKRQFLDIQSVEWLKIHRPIDIPSFLVHEKQKEFVSLVQSLRPWEAIEESLFLNSQQANGMHGIRHALRVSIFSMYLGLKFTKDDTDIHKFMYAGLLHDCKRRNDNSDPQHGTRAKLWLRKKFKEILPKLLFDHVHEISTAIGLHNTEYQSFLKNSEYLRYQLTTDILKTADALDRYRFPKVSWWINNNFLKITPPSDLKSFAFDLIVESEKLFLKKTSSNRSIEKAWKALHNLN